MNGRLKSIVPMLAFMAVVSAVGCGDDDPAGSLPTSGLDGGQPEAALDAVAPDGSVEPPKDGGTDVTSVPEPILGPRDRAGRAYLTRLLVSPANREDYNLEQVDMTSATSPQHEGGTTYGADFQAALVALDDLDGVSEWAGGSATAGPDDAGVYSHPLVNRWIEADALLVDPNQPFATNSYLDVEANAPAHTTCGGRWFGDDALDVTLSFLVNRSRAGVSDGVSSPAKPPSLSFPYLAEPF